MIPIVFPEPGALSANPPQRNTQGLPSNEEELKQLTQRAEAGDASAQFDLAFFYSTYAEHKIAYFKENIPSGSPNMRAPYNFVEKDYFTELVREERELAFAWYQRAAEQGLAEAIYELSICYRRGEGTATFPDRAQELLLAAAEKGYAPAQFDVGMQTYFGKEKGKESPVEIKPDYVASVKWLKKSAEQDYPLAQYYLGQCYENGWGVEKNYEEAFHLYKAAAESELLWALCALGRCYENGLGVEADVDQAIEYYTQAADQGDGEAFDALDRLEV